MGPGGAAQAERLGPPAQTLPGAGSASRPAPASRAGRRRPRLCEVTRHPRPPRGRARHAPGASPAALALRALEHVARRLLARRTAVPARPHAARGPAARLPAPIGRHRRQSRYRSLSQRRAAPPPHRERGSARLAPRSQPIGESRGRSGLGRPHWSVGWRGGGHCPERAPGMRRFPAQAHAKHSGSALGPQRAEPGGPPGAAARRAGARVCAGSAAAGPGAGTASAEPAAQETRLTREVLDQVLVCIYAQ